MHVHCGAMKKRLIGLIGLLLVELSAHAIPLYPNDQHLYDMYPWAASYYYGQTVSASLFNTLSFSWKKWPENIQSLEVSYVLDEHNWFRQLLRPLVGVVGIAGNTTIRYGKNENTIYEFDPYLVFRWANLPWNKVVNTSFAVGEGVSYDTSIPAIEKRQNSNTKRFLNYLMLEATFASPRDPRLQLFARIHHRSGVFGLYHAGNTGSNVVGLGIRYLF